MTDMLSLAAELAEPSGWRAQAPQSEGIALPSEAQDPPLCAQTSRSKERMVAKIGQAEELNYDIHPETGCWVWQRYCDPNGYGRAYDGKRMEWAHRVYYERHKGPIPDGYELDHLCENPPCVNPDHLEAVTKREHIRRTLERTGSLERCRRAARLRQRGMTYAEIADALQMWGKESAHQSVKKAIGWGLVKAEDIPRAEFLTDDDREDIRALYALGVPQTEIARWYDVDSSQVSRICSGRRSGHDRGAA